jgi:hypothetical protein
MASRSLRLADEQLGDGSIIEHKGDARTGTIYRFVSPRSPWPFGTFFLAVVRWSEERRLADIHELVEFAFRITTHVAFVAFGRLDDVAPAGGSLFRGHRLSPVDCSTIHRIPAHCCAEQ